LFGRRINCARTEEKHTAEDPSSRQNLDLFVSCSSLFQVCFSLVSTYLKRRNRLIRLALISHNVCRFTFFGKKVFSFEKLLSAEMAALSGSGHVHQRKIVLAESRKYLIYQQLGGFKQSPKTEVRIFKLSKIPVCQLNTPLSQVAQTAREQLRSRAGRTM